MGLRDITCPSCKLDQHGSKPAHCTNPEHFPWPNDPGYDDRRGITGERIYAGTPKPAYVPFAGLSEREAWAVKMVETRVWTPAERLELIDFLNYPKNLDNATEKVIIRILEARSRGEHIT